jgi:hypothetical protein
MQSENALLDLRLGILRVIADVWDDDKNNAGQLRAKLTQDDVYVAVNALLEHINSDGKKYPFENIPSLAVRFIAPTSTGPIWDRYARTWEKSKDEAIVLTLPSPSTMWSPTTKAIKLSEYYQYFPSMYAQDVLSPAINWALTSSRELAVKFSSFSSFKSKLPTDNYDLGVAEDNFLSFGALLLKVIARAWDDDEFAKTLIRDDKKETNLEYSLRLYRMLVTDFKYKLPWAFRLRFVFSDLPLQVGVGVPVAGWGQPSLVPFWSVDGKWLSYNKPPVRTLIELELPVKPIKEEDITCALAAYNTVGPLYPFTCS